jgi:hypothetical protein
MLVQAAEPLSETELRHFTSQLLALNAKRTASSVTQAELLAHINDRLPEDSSSVMASSLPNVMPKRSAMSNMKNCCDSQSRWKLLMWHASIT